MKDALCISLLIVVFGIICFGLYDQFNENKLCYGCANEDVNRDGKVDAKDLLIVRKYILNKMEDGECDE